MSAASNGRSDEIPAPAVSWSWNHALFGFVCSLPATVVAFFDVSMALALAFGVLPAAIMGIPERRAKRAVSVVIGALMGASIFVGSVVAQMPALAVAALIMGSVGAALLAERRDLGWPLLILGVPLIAVGFSYAGDLRTTAALGVVLLLGSLFAWLVSLIWPERRSSTHLRGHPGNLLGYGIRLGIAGGIAATVGFLAGWEHVGWAPAAAMLVMRPAPEIVSTRVIGRSLSVTAGALAGALLAMSTTSGFAYALAICAAITCASATHGSRWYITAAFTTFLVISLLSFGSTVETAMSGFNERVLETFLGVGLAFLLGVILLPRTDRRSTLQQMRGS